MYSYRSSLKSDTSDELINTYLLRPIAGFIVWGLYKTPMIPNQVTIASIIAGFAGAFFYLKGTPEAFVIAGLLVTLKDVLDSADGQLARARGQFSRIGRFLDSIGDFAVDVAIFGAIGWVLFQVSGNSWMLVMAFLGLAGITFRVSYHVFYHVSFLHLQKQYGNNRISEEVREEDRTRGGLELVLQRIFQIIYGWQDRLIFQVDRWSRNESWRRERPVRMERKIQETDTGVTTESQAWYSDIIALRISGLLGFGTELFLLMVCSVFNELEFYLYLNLFLMNGILVFCIFYRRIVVAAKIQKSVE